MSSSAMSAPSRASASPWLRPCPRAPPVIRATLPSKRATGALLRPPIAARIAAAPGCDPSRRGSSAQQAEEVLGQLLGRPTVVRDRVEERLRKARRALEHALEIGLGERPALSAAVHLHRVGERR